MTVLTAAVLTAVVVLSAPAERAATFGHPLATASSDVPPPIADDAGEAAEWSASAVVTDLLARRDDALVARDATQLASTTVPGGAGAREDADLLARLVSTDTILEDLRTRVDAVQGAEQVSDGTAVDVVLVQEPHARVVAGRRVAVPAQAPRCTRLVLTAADDGAWHVLRTEPCP